LTIAAETAAEEEGEDAGGYMQTVYQPAKTFVYDAQQKKDPCSLGARVFG
jgi:hypothetical protein